jgi:hypothetical protein
MNAQRSLTLLAALALVCLGLSPLLDRPLLGEAINPPPGAGRYQIVVKANGTNSVVFVFDPDTADVWYGETVYANKEWTHMGSPVRKEAPEPAK